MPVKATLNALTALVVATLIVLGGHLLTGRSTPSGPTEARSINGSEFRLPLGQGIERGEAVIASSQPPTPRVLALAPIRFRAENLSLVRVAMNKPGPPVKAFIVWRTDGPSRQTFFHPVPWRRHDSPALVDMSRHAGWKGNIVQIGLDFYSDEPIEALSIGRVSLLPPGTRLRLQALWQDWTSQTSWSASSINHLRGNTSDSWRTANLMLGAISLLALLIVMLLNRWQGRRFHAIQPGVVLLLPWVINDLLWQGTLSSRLEEARERFHGKTLHQRHLVDADADMYRYARHIKGDLLPEDPARVFIIHPDEGHVLTRLRLQYYLLPHNVFNAGKYPRDSALPGDYLVVLGTIPGLAFDGENRLLTWPGGQTGPVEAIDHNEHGRVYRLLEGNGHDA